MSRSILDNIKLLFEFEGLKLSGIFTSGIIWWIESISIKNSIPLTPLKLKIRLIPRIISRLKARVTPNSINSKVNWLYDDLKKTK